MRRSSLALVLFVACGSVQAFDLQGHRGARGLAPENTLAAFRKALDVGVSTIETDVGITRDGVPVIAHDRRLNPAFTRGPDGRYVAPPAPTLRSLDFAALRAYDVGRIDAASRYAAQWPRQVAADGERMPALEELLALVVASRKPVKLNLETKLSPLEPDDTVDPATFVRTILAAVNAAGLAGATTIQSFDWRTLVEAKRQLPAIRTSCLTTEGSAPDNVKPDASGRFPWLGGFALAGGRSLPRLVKDAGCDVWSPFWRDASRERIAEAKALGLAVVPWTVNAPDEMRRLIDAGVDGLITDYPDVARGVMAERNLPLP